MKKLLLLVALVTFNGAAYADCYLDGEPYPTGSVVSGLTCQADGSWR